MNFLFFSMSILLGIGLSMDALSVSLANGLAEPNMKKRKMALIAGVFGFFQAAMPFIGWVCVHTVVEYFKFFEHLIPWIALGLLGYIGTKMLIDGIKNKQEPTEYTTGLTFACLLTQGIATSIDALSAGFTISEYSVLEVLVCVGIIAAVTFVICMAGLLVGKKAATFLSGRAGILGGSILILIGLEIFVSSWF